MSTKKPERWPPEQWRRVAPTVADMINKAWDMTAKCRRCTLHYRVNLRVTVQITGPDFDLWNRTQPCKQIGCPGTMDFWFRPPVLMQPQILQAPWPSDWEPGKPGVFRSSARSGKAAS